MFKKLLALSLLLVSSKSFADTFIIFGPKAFVVPCTTLPQGFPSDFTFESYIAGLKGEGFVCKNESDINNKEFVLFLCKDGKGNDLFFRRDKERDTCEALQLNIIEKFYKKNK